MGLYVEVMCDERIDGRSENLLRHTCWSHNSNNPQGHTIAQARKEARRQGWIIRGNYACCPGCKKKLKPCP